MEASYLLKYEEKTKKLETLPDSLSVLKKTITSCFCISSPYKILIITQENSKIPITSSQQYVRTRLKLSSSFTIQVIPTILPSQEVPFSGILRRNTLKKRKLSKLPLPDPEEVPDNEKCSVCYNRFDSPMVAKCQHILCSECWRGALEMYLECPLCRQRVRFSHLIPYNQ